MDSRALLVALVDQETGQRGYVLTGDEAFLEPYRDGAATSAGRLAALRADFAGDPGMTDGDRPRSPRPSATWQRVGARPEIAARRAR